MVNAEFVSDARDLVAKTTCPSCGEPHLEFSLCCELSGADCLFMARCNRCHVTFDLDGDSFPPGLSADSLDSGNLSCPKCDQALAMMTLQCSVSLHSCRYALQCPECDGLTDDRAEPGFFGEAR